MQLLHLVERLHRQLLDVIKDEPERLGQTDINSVQALLLYNIGDAELTPGELRSRGHYLGSNDSYNLKQLVEKGYIRDQRSDVDRRSKRVSYFSAPAFPRIRCLRGFVELSLSRVIRKHLGEWVSMILRGGVVPKAQECGTYWPLPTRENQRRLL